jgi:hypothetical protein
MLLSLMSQQDETRSTRKPVPMELVRLAKLALPAPQPEEHFEQFPSKFSVD